MLPVFELLGFKIYSYPLFMGMSWAVGYILSSELNKKQNWPIPKFETLFLLLFFLSFLGAKLAFLFTFKEGNTLTLNSSFWLGGGFVFYGGVIAGSLTLFLFKLVTKTPWKSFYILLPSMCFAHAVGRLGCLLAGCCYGKITQAFWGLHLHNYERHPVQIYESVGLILMGLYFLHALQRKKENLLIVYFAAYALLRFCLEFFRGDLIRGIYNGLSFSQYVSLFILGISLSILILQHKVLRTQKGHDKEKI